MKNEKWILAGVAALVLFQVLSFFGSSLGVGTPNIEDYDPFIKTYGINTAKDITTSGTLTAAIAAFTSTFQVGSSGTVQDNQVISTCSMIANNSITATSTGYAYCTGVTGVTSADYVSANFATSTAKALVLGSDNWSIVSAQASTTAGAIDFILYNGTGANAVPSYVGRMASTTVIRASH